MNSPVPELAPETVDNAEGIATSTEPLFVNDCGQLPVEARRVLIHLLAGPFLDANHHSKLWRTLISYESVIRSRLAELFLELIIDSTQQIAFTRQADTGELETPVLLRRTHLTFIDSVLMLCLRQVLGESDTQGERAVISENELHEQLKIYEKTANTDQAGFRKRINAAIENAKKRNILGRIVGSKDRYEISPILKLIFGTEEVIALKKQYELLLAGQLVEENQSEACDSTFIS